MIDFPLETERLLLREYVADDWWLVHEYATDLLVVRYMPFGPNGEEETRTFVRESICARDEDPQTTYNLAVTLKTGDRLIGGCGFRIMSLRRKEGSIGYCFRRDVWGNGYAPEAGSVPLSVGFDHLGMHRIYADCDVRNTASARVMQKLGMQYEGRLRENQWYKGEWRDSSRYAILEHEWRMRQH